MGSSPPPEAASARPPDRWDCCKSLTLISSQGPLIFLALHLESTVLCVSLGLSPVFPAAGSLMPTPGRRPPSTRLCPVPDSPLGLGDSANSSPWLSPVSGLWLRFLGWKAMWRRHWGENPQAKQALTADGNCKGSGCAHTGRGCLRLRGRASPPLPACLQAALPPGPCTTPCFPCTVGTGV